MKKGQRQRRRETKTHKERERGVEAERRKIKPRKPRGDWITRLPIDLLSCDVEITSLNRQTAVQRSQGLKSMTLVGKNNNIQVPGVLKMGDEDVETR